MKILGKVLLATTLLAGTLTGLHINQVDAAPPVSIQLDNYPLSFPTEPIIVEGTTMVPFRAISEALGIQITWNQSTKTIDAVQGEGANATRVQLTLNNKKAIVNGSTVNLNVAPQSVSGNTLIPLSFFSQQFGADVKWDQATRTVSITSPQKRLYTLGFYAIKSISDAGSIPSLDSVAFGWSRIDENGNFTLTGKDFYMPSPLGDVTSETLVSSATDSRTTPYLMVYSGDVNGELTKIIDDAELRKQAISGMISTAINNKFKGIMLDFEGLGLTTDKTITRESFNSFVKDLSKETNANGLKLSLALHALNSSYQGYDYKTLGKIADEIIIMAYDYQNTDQPEPIDKVNEAIALAVKETDPAKLVLGLNMYHENTESLNPLIGLAKRYNLKGIALWRLGLITSDQWTQVRQSVEFKK
ncbi:glycosyl hydrolase [Paenibacillus anaericanus]|uniref:Glycosyl hydrolase n=1 Tax=Paenibacillus anaericanus TaxID=170367 RepID=A0A3S1C323_9BACL|nr:glycosyl hydrolase [Paenibacillus anaericanus]